MEISNLKNCTDISNLCGNIVLRKLKNIDIDYRLLEKWYLEEDVYTQFEQRVLNYDEIVNKYLKRTFDNTSVPTYIIEYNKVPVGLIQYKLVNEEDKKLYCINENTVYEIDVFIGEVAYRHRGIGSSSIKLLVEYLFNLKGADSCIMCPLVDNENAILCYKKIGFKIIRKFETNDTVGNLNTYYLMSKD